MFHARCRRLSLGLLCLAAVQQTPSSAVPSLQQGKEAFARGDYARAAALFESITDGTDACEASYYRGLSLQRLKEFNSAIVALQTSASCSSAAAPHLALAEAWIAKGDDNRAAASLEAALRSEPRNAGALRALSSIYLRHEVNDKAVPILRRLVEVAPKDAEAHADLAAAYAGAVDFANAHSEFEKALSLDPRHAGALTGLANLLLKTEHASEAL